MKQDRKYDLEERLIKFAVLIMEIAERLPKNFIGKHLAGQIVRSGTSPALNYGEAQGAESKNDFIHKMRICLKELRETQICLRIIEAKPLLPEDIIAPVLRECSELVAIFTASIQKARGKR